jgi:hypothetical protein
MGHWHDFEADTLTVFEYALKAKETKRQYPRRFKVYLDFLNLEGSLRQQSIDFLNRAKKNAVGTYVLYAV